MRYEKIILVRIIYFHLRYVYGWLRLSSGVSMRENGGGGPSSTACGSHTGARAGSGTRTASSA